MVEEIFLTGAHIKESDVHDRIVVVLDVLRTNATIATALLHDARAVVPVADMAEGGKIAANLDAASYIMGGERGGTQIDGYALSNSPSDYTHDAVADKTVILNTTHGTPTIARCRSAALVLIGGFFNISAITDVLRELDQTVVVVCAGWRNRVSLEDTLCAGMLLHRLWDGEAPAHISDSIHIAYHLYKADHDQLDEALRHCSSAQSLIEQGRGADVAYCFERDQLPVLPVYRENRVTLVAPSLLIAQAASVTIASPDVEALPRAQPPRVDSPTSLS